MEGLPRSPVTLRGKLNDRAWFGRRQGSPARGPLHRPAVEKPISIHRSAVAGDKRTRASGGGAMLPTIKRSILPTQNQDLASAWQPPHELQGPESGSSETSRRLPIQRLRPRSNLRLRMGGLDSALDICGESNPRSRRRLSQRRADSSKLRVHSSRASEALTTRWQGGQWGSRWPTGHPARRPVTRWIG